MRRPDEWGFRVDPLLAEEIGELLAALGRGDPSIDCYLDAVDSGSEGAMKRDDMWLLRWYYAQGGWRLDGPGVDIRARFEEHRAAHGGYPR